MYCMSGFPNNPGFPSGFPNNPGFPHGFPNNGFMSDFTDDFVDSTPIIGHGKALAHYMNGDTKKGGKALYKSTRSTAVIAGGVVGNVVSGPGGGTVGSVSAGVVTDIVASTISGEKLGYVKHGDDFLKEVNDGKVPVKPAIRIGLQLGFDASTGLQMNLSTPNNFREVPSIVGREILKKSVYMGKEGFRKKVNKQIIKRTAEYSLKDKSNSRAKKTVDSDSDSDSDPDTDSDSEYDPDSDYESNYDPGFDSRKFKVSDSEYIRYREYPYVTDPYPYLIDPYRYGSRCMYCNEFVFFN